MAGAINLSKPSLAKHRVEWRPGHGYFVIDPDGKRVGPYTLSKTMADQTCDAKQRAADAAQKRVQRPCLRCGSAFQSEGIHNRMCSRCRSCSSSDEAAPFSFGSIHGRKRA